MATLIAQVGLLVLLNATVGLRAPGWAVGLIFAAVTAALLTHGLSGVRDFGPADGVTAARTVLIGGVAALVADGFLRPPPLAALVALVAVALLLDGVDGQVARRTGTASPFGARFDMEADSFLLLVLSVHVGRSYGWWVLLIGGMRYAFLLGIWTLPWMRGQLPPRFWRKVVAATQGVALVVATSGLLPGVAAVALLLAALALLVESFGRDVRWLWRHGHLGRLDHRDLVRPLAVAGRQRDRRRIDAGDRHQRSPAGGLR